MAEPRGPETTNPASAIAGEMRSKGMSTVKIMRALFASANSLSNTNASTSIDILNQAVAIDVQAADLHHKLKTSVQSEIDGLNKQVANTKNNIALLSSVKTAASLATTFSVDLQTIEREVAALEDRHKKVTEAVESFISQKMKPEFATLANKQPAEIKGNINRLRAEVKQQVDATRKTLLGDSMRSVSTSLMKLAGAVAQATASSIAPGTVISKPQQ